MRLCFLSFDRALRTWTYIDRWQEAYLESLLDEEARCWSLSLNPLSRRHLNWQKMETLWFRNDLYPFTVLINCFCISSQLPLANKKPKRGLILLTRKPSVTSLKLFPFVPTCWLWRTLVGERRLCRLRRACLEGLSEETRLHHHRVRLETRSQLAECQVDN